ncbi:MAG: 6,7-dimethyl-8-ribityllumazine synthase [Saprospiraceae bacterium]|nr:6,7-dimethyl-8-ribityllumazine synthase [Saprospiraceae bacterium]
MSSSNKNLSTIEVSEVAQLKNVKIGIVTSEWNHKITFALLDGCTATLKSMVAQTMIY